MGMVWAEDFCEWRSWIRSGGEYIDDQIIANLRLASAAAPDHDRALDGDATGGAGPTEITLAGISKARELLNRANVPQMDRWLLVPP